MRDRREERRLMLEAIIDDPGATHSDRLRADEQLRELEVEDLRIFTTERLTPEQAAEELRSLGAAVPGMIAVAAGPDAVQPPVDVSEYETVIELQVELIATLEARLAERDRALQRLTLHRRLPPAPESVGP